MEQWLCVLCPRLLGPYASVTKAKVTSPAGVVDPHKIPTYISSLSVTITVKLTRIFLFSLLKKFKNLIDDFHQRLFGLLFKVKFPNHQISLTFTSRG